LVKVNLAAVAPRPWLDGNQVESLFRQEEIWIDRYRETFQIADMSDTHLMFTHRFVRRHYRRWRAYTLASWFLEAPWFGIYEGEEELNPLPIDVRETSLFKALDREMRHRRIEELAT